MAELWKANSRLSTAPWESRRKREIPTFPQLRRRVVLLERKKTQKQKTKAVYTKVLTPPFIRRPKLSSAKAWRNNRLDSLQLLGRIGPNVNFGGRQITVPQPQRNFPNVLSCLEHHHCAGMAPMSLAT